MATTIARARRIAVVNYPIVDRFEAIIDRQLANRQFLIDKNEADDQSALEYTFQFNECPNATEIQVLQDRYSTWDLSVTCDGQKNLATVTLAASDLHDLTPVNVPPPQLPADIGSLDDIVPMVISSFEDALED